MLLRRFHILNPTADKFSFFKAHLLVKDGMIEKIFKEDESLPYDPDIVDGNWSKMIFPGFIQTHIHLCQTAHRNLAEEMPLISWLKKEIWPYEASLDRTSMGKTVLLSIKELVSNGTTAVLDMGTVHQQDVLFEIAEHVGFRYTGGKAMMDLTDDCPQNLREKTQDSIAESVRLMEKYHGAAEGLLHYAFCPRFLLSCSENLLREVRSLSDRHNILIHSHAAEHPGEVEIIRQKTGMGNIAYLHEIGALNEKSVFAHMIHLDDDEKRVVRDLGISIIHCPSTNLKLGSGIAPIEEYLKMGVKVGLGADGAPCNNALSPFFEMKLASLIQKGIHHNPEAMPPEKVLSLLTTGGAKILGQDRKIGSIEAGKDADLVILDMDTPQTYNYERNPAAALVFGADGRNVYATMVRGRFLFREGKFSDEIEELDRYFNDTEYHSAI